MTLSASLPEQTTPSNYCYDEDILVIAGADFGILTPQWQQMAYGQDGSFAEGTPWVLTSASVDFGANGVNPNQVVHLTQPKTLYKGGGHFLAIDSVTDNSIVLRRPHKDLYVGQPPSPADGLSGVEFTINTLDPQIEEATFDLKRRFEIDDAIGGSFYRSSSWVYDLRDLRMACILQVLYDRYTHEARTSQGDFMLKIKRVRQQLDDVLARLQVRWGPFGNSSEPSTLFGCKLSR